MKKRAANLSKGAVALTTLLISACSAPTAARQYTYLAKVAEGNVTTYAGVAGSRGLIDGPVKGTLALFSAPAGIAVDSSGNVYTSDSGSGLIRKITPAGKVTTVVTQSTFTTPAGLAVDGKGHLYVADAGSGTVSMVTLKSGAVYTVASALVEPYGVAVNASGTKLFYSDAGGSTVHKMTSSDGFITSAHTSTPNIPSPRGLTLDATGNLWVVDGSNDAVWEIASATTGWTTPTELAFTVGAFTSAHGIAVDSGGTLYVVDQADNNIMVVSPTVGTVNPLAGNLSSGSTDGPGTIALFTSPQDLAFDKSGTNLYVADSGNNTVRRLTTSVSGGFASGNADAGSTSVETYAGWPTTFYDSSTQTHAGTLDGDRRVALFANSEGIFVDSSGNVYVADFFNFAIRKITPEGMVTTVAGSGTQGHVNGRGRAACFTAPKCVVMDSKGILYVGDAGGPPGIRMIDKSGNVTDVAVDFTQASLQDSNITGFQDTQGIAIDSSDNLYVGDFYKGVLKLTWKSGNPGMDASIYADFVGIEGIRYVAVGKDRTVYFANQNYQQVFKASTAGSWSAVTDSHGVPVPLNTWAVAVDKAGNVYGGNADLTANPIGGAIYQITPAGHVSTIAGSYSASGSADGRGTDARFLGGPPSYAFDSAGRLYVVDGGNSTIRRIQITNKPVL